MCRVIANGVNGVASHLKVDDSAKIEKKRKQALGARIWEVYIVILFVCILVQHNVVTEFENSFKAHDFMDVCTWMSERMWICFAIAGFYIVSIFGIQKYMKNRPKFNLKYTMAAWNLLLAIFSFCGACRTLPTLINLYNKVGVYGILCENGLNEWVATDPAGPWSVVFLWSKIPELVDTYFVVLQGKQLIVLHWVHHFSVMMCGWHGAATMNFNGIVFIAMNYTVHAAMYFFYFLGALGYRPTKYARMLTRCQISQMVVGMMVNIYLIYYLFVVSPFPYKDELGVPSTVKSVNRETDEWVLEDHGYCKANASSVLYSLLIYFVYFCLFLSFYIQVYVVKKSRTERAKSS